jgi:hypothetical protein
VTPAAAFSRRPRRVPGSSLILIGAATTIVLAACSAGSPAATKPLTMDAMGQAIVIPVPLGMRRWKVDAFGVRHQFEPLVPRREGPYFATAMMRGANERIAQQTYDQVRSEHLGPAEGEPLTDWQAALRGGLAGENGPLPDAPEGFLTIERDTMSVGTVIDVVHMRKGDDRSLIGSATLILHERALSLDIVMKQPIDRAELAAVRTHIRAWVRAVRAANP